MKRQPPSGESPAVNTSAAQSPSDSDSSAKQSRSTREETTTRILDAAEELFSRRDPAKVTVREIAEKAGVTHPLVHQYVGSKAAVLKAVLERGAPQRQKTMSEHPEFREATPLVLNDIMNGKVHTRSVLRAVMDGSDYADFEDRKKSARMYLGLAKDSLGKGRRRAPAPDAMDPEIVLAAVIALTYGWTATEDALTELFNVGTGKEQTREQIIDICIYLTELIYPPAEETSGQ